MGAPFATEQIYGALTDLDREGELPIRLSITYYVNTPALAENAVRKLEAYSRKYKTDHVWSPLAEEFLLIGSRAP